METRSAVSAVCDVIITFLPVDVAPEHLPPFCLLVCLPPASVYSRSHVADTRPRLTESGFIEPSSFAQDRFYGNKPDFAFQFWGVLLTSKKRWKKHFWRFSSYFIFFF